MEGDHRQKNRESFFSIQNINDVKIRKNDSIILFAINNNFHCKL